jgi:hypothetical protein
MCAVGKGLASLEDPEARLRVLRWANERFQPGSTPLPSRLPSPVPAQAGSDPAQTQTAPVPAGVPAQAPAIRLAPEPEPDLTVDDLDDLFEEPADPPPAAIVEDDRVFLSDAEDLLSATEDLGDLYEPASEPARPILHLVPREELPFDQLVDDFVDSFRRLTREWQGV